MFVYFKNRTIYILKTVNVCRTQSFQHYCNLSFIWTSRNAGVSILVDMSRNPDPYKMKEISVKPIKTIPQVQQLQQPIIQPKNKYDRILQGPMELN